MLLLVITIWSATRLWLAQSQAPVRGLMAISTAAPILAAATIPVGALAVLAMELAAYTAWATGPSRFWRRRSLLVVTATVVIIAVFLPAILHKAEDYWAEITSPLSLRALWKVAGLVYLNGWQLAHHGSIVLVASVGALLLAMCPS